ncbi:MAG: epoxyqueuosine reductase, partial [Synergistaceae bacterium]|nr:epoxyqueuosine reductase [Synergistaceae bacterium]
LCDGLITPLGKAMRVGSVVALMDLPPTPRPYSDHRQYCLFFSDGTCGKCIGRCPVGAITKEGHDKEKCYQHVHVTAAAYAKAKFGIDGLGCGLCQTGVPCESRIPTAEDV